MRWGLLLLLGACSFSGPSSDSPDDPGPDADAGCTAPGGAVLRMQATAGSGPSTFTGILNDPWTATPIQRFDIADAAWRVTEDPGYTDSMVADVRIIHDGERLFFGITITDEAVIGTEDNANLGTGDAIVLLIDAADDRAGELGDDDHLIVVDASGSFADRGPAPATNLDVGVAPTARGWNVELGVDKDELAAELPGVLGFNILLVDDDNLGEPGRDALGAWESPEDGGCPGACSGASSPLCDTSLFGELELL